MPLLNVGLLGLGYLQAVNHTANALSSRCSLSNAYEDRVEKRSKRVRQVIAVQRVDLLTDG